MRKLIEVVSDPLPRDEAATLVLEAWQKGGRKGHPVLLWMGRREEEGPRGGILPPTQRFKAFICCADEVEP